MRDPDLLAQTPLFNFLSPADRQRMARQMVEARYGKNQFIFQEGDPAEYLYIVKEGAVKCVKCGSNGKDVTLKILMPGDLFCCEAAMLDGAPHPGCARPMGEASVLKLSKTAYLDLLKRNPDAALAVIKYLGRRLNEAQENAKTLALDRAEQRLASLLVTLAERTGVPDRDGIRLSVRLTRQDLADMTGMTVETTIRILSRLKHADLVTGTANRILIRDLKQLKQLADTTTPSLPQLASSISKNLI